MLGDRVGSYAPTSLPGGRRVYWPHGPLRREMVTNLAEEHGRLARWRLQLAELTFKVEYSQGPKIMQQTCCQDFSQQEYQVAPSKSTSRSQWSTATVRLDLSPC
jgi:hypothetical protein